MDFVVIILGRTSKEWTGEILGEELGGRAGFNSFGSPAELVDNLDCCPHSLFFDRDAFLRAGRIVLYLVDVCQPELGECLAVEHPTRPIIFDRRRLDFNELDQLAELPVAHLILHDKRTLQIFAYSGCIPFLVNNRLHPSGTFLIHGLKKDALFDLPKESRQNAIELLTAPPSLESAGNAACNCNLSSAVFSVLVEVRIEDEIVNGIQGDEDVDEASGSETSRHQARSQDCVTRSLVLVLSCHPEDSVEALRLRLYDLSRRLKSCSDAQSQDEKSRSNGDDSQGGWELPIGFDICPAPIGLGVGFGRASEVTRSFPWLPFKHASLRAALRAARCDTSGRLPPPFSALREQPPRQPPPPLPAPSLLPSASADLLPVAGSDVAGNREDSMSAAPSSESRLRTPLLRPRGSPGLPLRRTALASSLGIDHDCGIQGCSQRFCCEDGRQLGVPPSSILAMRSVAAENCPLTGVNGLVLLGLSSRSF